MSSLPQGRPGVNGYKGEKGEPSGGLGHGVSLHSSTNFFHCRTWLGQKGYNKLLLFMFICTYFKLVK